MSQREELKDPLLEELSNLEVFRRLVRCTPARGKLLRIVAALMSSNKALPRRLSEAYVGRFAVSQSETEEDLEQAAAAAASAAAVPDVAGRPNCSNESRATCSTTTTTTAAAAVASCSSNCSGDSKKKTAAALAAAVIQEIPLSPPILDTLPLIVHAVSESVCDEDALATDLGLRLGSFLSEAGWMQESISVLVCLNERLKHMQPFKNDLVIRLDCLQRYALPTSSPPAFESVPCSIYDSFIAFSLQSPLCSILALQFQASTENIWRTAATES